MIEKFIYFFISSLMGIISYFIHRTLNQIEEKQKDHTKSLYNISERVIKIESKQIQSDSNILNLNNNMQQINVTTKEAKSILDHSLYEMRQELKQVKDAQYDIKSNYGKVIVLVENLYRVKKKDP